MIKNEWGIKRPDVKELPFNPNVLGSIVCFSLSDDVAESGGSGFLAYGSGIVITACHVLKNRVEEWRKIENVPVFRPGQPVIRGFSLIEANPEKDYAILQSENLSSAYHLTVNKNGGMDKEGSYWVLGFPDSFTDFPFRKTLAVSRGKFIEETTMSRPFLQRLSCAIWNGFSGGPVVNKDGFVRGITIAGSISRTPDDIADILPLSEIAYP